MITSNVSERGHFESVKPQIALEERKTSIEELERPVPVTTQVNNQFEGVQPVKDGAGI